MSKIELSPVKKRRKLSLKVNKNSPGISSPCDGKSESLICGKSPSNEAEKESASVEKGKLTEAEIPSPPEELNTGPGIIGFMNLGNTCFLNSVLQILRYTPGFLDGLEELNKDVTEVEKLQREIAEESKKELGDEYEKASENLSVQVAKILQQLFTRMDARERRFRQLGSSAVASMTVRPDRLLEMLRRINPMFEGYLQHDAQELLRCLLCYIQDALKENSRVRMKYKELEMKKTTTKESSLNNITKYFGTGLQKSSLETNITRKDVKTALFVEKKEQESVCLLGTISPPIKLKSKTVTETVTSVQYNGKNCETVTNCRVTTENTQVQRSYDETDSMCQVKSSSSSVSTKSTCKVTLCKKNCPVTPVSSACVLDTGNGRRRTRHSLLKPTPGSSNIDVTPKSETRGSKRKKIEATDKDLPLSQDMKCSSAKRSSPGAGGNVNGLAGGGKSQPSVLSMFGKREAGCRRLGMRGAVVTKIHNGVEAPQSLHDKPTCGSTKLTETSIPDHTGDGPSVIPDPSIIPDPAVPVMEVSAVLPQSLILNQEAASGGIRSQGKRCPGVLEHVSEKNLKSAALQDIKQAKVKLEKCDTVCNSPLKSVSAHEAIKKLGVPEDKHKDFVEHLFQGMMMLRTRCMECECSRERQEVFQDVSVPLKKTPVVVEDNQNESDEEVEEPSLSCLMSAFTDVEKLCDDNKYFCENCFSYVEAERSLHYETLPEILTLHLKRFAASSGYFGNLTKINDHVATPEYLPCLRYKCPRPCHRRDHRYKLFGLIAHSGMSITSGHYMSYVKLLPESKAVQNLMAKPEKIKPRASKLETFMEKTSVKVKSERVEKTGESSAGQCATGCARGAAALPGDSLKASGQDTQLSEEDTVSGPNLDSKLPDGYSVKLSCKDPQLSDADCLTTAESSVTTVTIAEVDSLGNTSLGDTICDNVSEDILNKWLECDDDFVQVLDEEDFERRLAPNSGYNATPYVLFYIKDKDVF